MDAKKQRLMTNKEKEQFLNKVKIVTEDIATSSDPKDTFKASLNTYQDSMKEQISNLKKLLKVQIEMRNYANSLLDKEIGLDEETVKTEIKTRDEVIAGVRSSIAVMEERVRIGESLADKLIDSYDILVDLDFYWNGVLNMTGTPERAKQVVENYVEE